MKSIDEIRKERNRLTRLIRRLNKKSDTPAGLRAEEWELLDTTVGQRDALNWVLKA
jgi:hypothetical protein